MVSAAMGVIAVYVKAFGDDYGFNFLKNEADYLLGSNPKNFCDMEGYGSNSPKQTHHRGTWGGSKAPPNGDNLHILYCGVVGGISTNDDYVDKRSEYGGHRAGGSLQCGVGRSARTLSRSAGRQSAHQRSTRGASGHQASVGRSAAF